LSFDGTGRPLLDISKEGGLISGAELAAGAGAVECVAQQQKSSLNDN
jgi:hypothetical protein